MRIKHSKSRSLPSLKNTDGMNLMFSSERKVQKRNKKKFEL